MSTTQARRLAVVAVAVFCGLLSTGIQAQTKVRFAEVAHSLLFAPVYVAFAKGYFKDAGLDVSSTTIPGGDKTMAALLSNSADVGLMGPEAAMYVWNSESSTKAKIFAGLTTTDGFILMSRQKIGKFDWKMLKDKEVLAFRPGSSPLLFLESAMRRHGVDPRKDVKLANNIPYPARVGAWLAGQQPFGIFDEPAASQLEKDGKAFPLASIGREVGAADYSVFMATDRYIKEQPVVIQSWTNAVSKAMKWTEAAQTAELVKILAEFFPGIDAQILGAAVERYRGIRIWKSSPLIEPGPMRKFEDTLVEGGVLENTKRVKFENVVITDFARNAR
ncbi:MAG: ABC transporter substrate-binding protein [Betaproteobacteria bacterium]|nr:ABC transporter substrate-binding protein [Betaproteobacteria bacterium]